MRRSEKDALYLYLINNLTRLEGEYIQSRDWIRYRCIDEVDCLECLLALTRLKAFKEFSADISAILKLYKNDS